MDDSSILSIINNVVGQAQSNTAALPAVLSQAAQSGTTPDQEAEWQRLAKESNVPAGLIRNGAPVKLMQLQQQAAELPATNPVTARTLMDPDNAAVAHDDIGTLTRLEDLARNGFGAQNNAPISTLQFGTARDRAEANYFGREYGQKPFQAIQGGTGKLATKLAFPVAGAVDAVNGNDDYKEFASQLYDAFSDIQTQSAAAPEQGFGGKLFRSLEELAPMVMTGNFGLGSIVGQAVNDKYDDLTAKGIDPDTATALALKAGMSAYAMTKLPFGGTSLGNSLVRGATLNPAFGVLDRALDKAGLNYVGYDKQADAIDLTDPEQIAHDMALGLVFGAQHAVETGRPIAGNSVLETLLPFYDTYRAGQRADTLQAIGDTVQASKLNNRNPDLLQQHLQQVGEENGIDQVYVPIKRWNTLFQDAGIDPAQAANDMLSNPEAYHEANTTGADIPIPYGEFTGKLSGLKDVYPELVKDTRLGIGDSTLREAEEAKQQLVDRTGQGAGLLDALKGMMGKSLDETTKTDSSAKVYDDVYDQQLQTGTARSQAETNARLMSNAFRVLGDRAGVDPFELYRGYNLKLSGPDAVLPASMSDLAGNGVNDLYQSGKPPVTHLTGTELGDHGNDIKSLRNAAIQWYRDNLQKGEPVHRDDLGDIHFTKKGRDEIKAFSANPDKLKLVPALRDIIKDGDYVREENLDHPRKDGIVKFHIIEADTKIGDKLQRTKVLVGEDSKGNKFYDLFPDAEEHENKKASKRAPVSPNDGSLEGLQDEEGATTLHQSIPQSGDGVNIQFVSDSGTTRGFIRFDNNRNFEIGKLKDADLSTFIHESGHFITEVMGDRAGVDPYELYPDHNLKPTRPMDAAPTDRIGADTSIDPMLERLRAGDVPKLSNDHLALAPLKYHLDQAGIDLNSMDNQQVRDHLKARQELWKSINNYKLLIEPLIKSANESKTEHKSSKIGNVQNWLAEEARSNGVNIDGYLHSIDTSAIRHILKRHGDVVSEGKRDLVAVTPKDISSIPEIIAAPDKVVFGAKNKRNQDLIIYLKTMPDGSTLYIEEARVGKKELATASMRKYPATSRAESILSTLDPTAKTNGENNLKIVEVPGNVKSMFRTGTGHLAPDGTRELYQNVPTWSPEELMQKYNTDEQSNFGPVWRDLAHNDKGAIDRLTQYRTGEAAGALHHPDVGDIDLVWGKEGTAEKAYEDGYGLAKILVKHPDVVDNLQQILKGMTVASRGKNRIQLESEEHKAAVRLDWEGVEKKWLLTEFKKDQEIGTGKRTGVPSFTGQDSPVHQSLVATIFRQNGSEVNTLLQSTVNHLAADGVKELYKSEKSPVSEITGKELSDHLDAGNVITKARAYFKENLQGRVISRDGFGDVRVSGKGWEKAKGGLKTDLLKAQLIPAIPDIIKNGEYHGREELSRKRKDDVVAFHFFTGDVLLDGKQVKTGVTVAEDTFGNLFYNLNHDTDALWAKLKAPLLPGSEARSAEPSRDDESSTLNESIPNTGDLVNIKFIDDDRTGATASTTPSNSDDHVKKVVTGVLHSAITRIETPADAAHIAFPLTRRAQEAAIAIVTDAKGNVLGVVQHSTGSLDSTIMSPRDLLGVVHDFPGAAEVWFAHNHPSGDPSSSHADREITSLLNALLDGSGIKSRGMIIVGQEGGAVWTNGKGDRSESIPLSSLNMDKERTRKIKTYDREIVKLPSSKSITDVKQVINYARLFGDGDSGIIILNSQRKPVSFVPMSMADMTKLKTGDPATGSSSIMSAFHKGNGTSMVMIVPTVPGSQAAARNVAAFGNMFDAPLSDVIYAGNGLSYKNTGRMPEILNRFYQGGDVRRGYIRFDNSRNFEIGLLKDANLSTFIHESGHFFTEVLGDLAERPDAPRQIRDDYAALLGFAGVESRDAIQAEHHEKLARAFEAYIREGSAPSVGMHSVFQRMKAWMIGVYKDLTALDVQLTPEIRDVFDRMLATDTEIGRMRDMEDMKPLFATAEDAGMSQAEFALYRKDAEQAGELAKEQLLRELMAGKDREQKSWWKDERKKTWAEVEGETEDDPVYQAYHVLTTGKTFDGRAMGDIKLSRPDLVKMYGEDFVKKLPREFQRVYSKEGGLHPDAVAEMAGFGSGDEMVRKMAGALKLKDYVKAETDRRMRERYGDMMTDGLIHEQALKDVHNDAQGKVVRAELLAIRRKAGEGGPAVKAGEERGTADAARDRAEHNAMLEAIPPDQFFRMTASEAMGAKRVADIQPHLYVHAAGKAAREASEAAAKGDYRRAGEAKYRELLNHYLYREADRAKDFTDKVQAYAAKMGSRKDTGKFGQTGGQFLDQIRAILDRYGFNRISDKEADERMPYRESLDAFLRRMKDEEGVELPIPDAVRQEIRRTSYRNLPVDELREVYDSMRMLEHGARQINQVSAGGRKVEVTQAALSLSNTLLRSIKGVSDMARKSDGAVSLLDRVKDVNLDIPVLLPEFMFERFDGLKKTGPWHEFIRDRYNDAADHQVRLREMLFPKIMDYAHADAIDRSMGKIHIDALNADLVKDDIIAIALNCGNESNLDKLMRGGLRFKGNDAPTALNHKALQEILSHLSAKEIDVVNGIWKTIDTLKPEAAVQARKRTGVEPNWIEKLPMHVKNGTLEGGYYPVKYDPRYIAVDGNQSDPSTIDRMFNKYGGSSTRQGDPKERTSFAAPLSLDWQSMVSRHLDEAVTEISHGQFVADTQRLLKRPEVKDAINERLGSAYYKNLLDWVGYTVNQDDISPVASGDIEMFRRQIRSNMSTYALGFKVANAVNGMAADIPPMMKQVKIASAFKGIMQFIRNPAEATRFATQASEYMRNIDTSLDRDIARALQPLAGPHGVGDDILHWSIASRAFLQKIGAVMAWHAGYIDAQEQGLQGNAAVRNADSVCRMTQEADRSGDASAAPHDTYLKELARFIGPTMKDYLDRAVINPESGHKAWYNVQKAQEWLAVLQPTVSGRIAKILKPSENIRPFSNDALKQSGEQVYYQSASHALDRIATDIDPAAASMRKYPATTRAESILSSLGPNVRNDGGVSDLKVVESPVSVKANDFYFQAGLATLLAGYVGNAMISGIMNGKQTDKLDKLPSWILARLTLGLFDGFPLMRNMDGHSDSGITVGKDKEMRPSSVFQWSKDAVEGFTKTVEATTGGGGWNKAAIRGTKAAGGATGLPAQAGSTVGRYIYDVLSGDYKPEHPWLQVGGNSPL